MIFDIEADGLLDKATKIHVLAYTEGGKVKHTHDYKEMARILSGAKLLIGHNIIGYDIPVIERILGIRVKARLIDTLALSWYVNHRRVRHGLEGYGDEYGVPKPEVDDWENLSPEEYAHRCIEDVKINKRLWTDLKAKLLRIYGDKVSAGRLLDYLSFKMRCAMLQEKSRWKADKALIEESIATLESAEAEKIEQLKAVMPKVPVYAKRTRPAKPFKKDGTWSVTGCRWFNLLKEHNLPEDYDGVIEVMVSEEEPKPSSHIQVKDWLTSLGWEPATFDYKKNDDGTERRVPQVRVQGENGKELCPSVTRLIGQHPTVGVLEGLTVIQHRLSVFRGFARDMSEDGYLVARVGGLTNTMRFKHRELVNLPGVDAEWGEQIRGSLVARQNKILCGSDMCSLESTTKRHYMFPHDPDYVAEMSKPGFDEHLDLAKLAGEVTQQDIDEYNAGSKPALKAVRKKFKPANYAGIYGVAKKTLSRQTGMSQRECQRLLDVYWQRNWSVKRVAEELTVKTVDGEMWLFNPVSELWYSLRYEKDRFSTLNQGTGVYCFDRWIWYILSKREQLTGQFHDEIILEILEGAEDKCEALLKWAIGKVNDELNLNVPLDVDVQFGYRYSDIH